MGIEYAKLNGYTIYQFEVKNTCNYFLAIPDNYVTSYQLFIGFPKKDLKYIPKKDIIGEIDEIKKMITAINSDGVYLLPDIPVSELEEAARENDGKKYNQILNEKIRPMINEAYQTLTSYATAERTINQVIRFVKQTESDSKFVDWFEMNMPNFIHGITYEEIKKYYYSQVALQIESIDKSKEQIFENPNKATDKLAEFNNNYANNYDLNNNVSHIYQDPKEYEQTRGKVKVRKLVKPKPGLNNQGFSNILKTILLLTGIITVSIIISKFLFIKS